jgi:hypothetical protein
MPAIDLNSDVGELFGNWTFGDDSAIIASVSRVNVACGFHAGDPEVARDTKHHNPYTNTYPPDVTPPKKAKHTPDEGDGTGGPPLRT